MRQLELFDGCARAQSEGPGACVLLPPPAEPRRASSFAGRRRSDAVREALARICVDEDAVIGREGLGWRYDEERNAHGRRLVVLDEAELDTVHRIVDLHAAGESLRAIARQLTAEGRRTKRGGAWHASTVRAVLARGH